MAPRIQSLVLRVAWLLTGAVVEDGLLEESLS